MESSKLDALVLLPGKVLDSLLFLEIEHVCVFLPGPGLLCTHLKTDAEKDNYVMLSSCI